ncbi:methenyltetrahydromethanopterin cyclohydrolase [Moorella sp. Hama-1]|uniref:methenyltetrahydromethanopterin cyclohydrolase n=1 Tax=Moorella sp. Hama-1 TaxID=2138101 RepID=UPI000D64A3A2|nr:methenyltetrahydromethanopterin cyclohydrolase [Moorella sp. Hama-1]BCV21937.1 N(5),N(10)-methenyltetrahydromethanopterin cyclohydrolase [Moorella sp. Hama-1]
MPVPKLKASPDLSPNLQALPLVREILARPGQLNVEVHTLEKATVIDCGVQAPGGWEAGRLFAAICLGGLARVELRWINLGDWRWPAVEVTTDHPVRACLASQYAGWSIKKNNYFAMGSGPGRAAARGEDLFLELDYEDCSGPAIVCLESNQLPPPEVVGYIARQCKRNPADVYLLVAPTASPAGSVQIAARAVETGLHKLMELGYNLGLITSGWGVCPVPPVAADDLAALGRTNDAVLYGSMVYYNLRDEDVNLASLVDRVPSRASRDYGRPFGEIFRRYGDFYSIDPFLFSPAEVWLSNLKSGRTFHAGSVRPDILASSFGLAV